MTEEPPVRRRLLGGALRRYREDLGLALEDAASTLECDRSKISRIETGHRGIRPKELRELLTEFGVPEDEQQVLTGLASRPARDGWWEEFQEVIPDTAVDHLIMESGAAEIMSYDPMLIPELLQTPGYARAAAAARPEPLTDSQLEESITALAARQQSVLSGSTQLSVVIGEAALCQEIGEPRVRAGQISRLIELASHHPGLALQVIPFAAGAHAAVHSGAFTIIGFTPGIGVVYLPALTGGAHRTGQADLFAYTRAFTLLRATALSSAQATQLLRQMLDDLPPGR